MTNVRRAWCAFYALSILAAVPGASFAADVDHTLGLAYSSGLQDIVDFYDDQPLIDVFGVPVGFVYRPVFNFTSPLRVDISVGPIAVIFVEEFGGTTEIDYFSLSTSVTAGWNFLPDKTVNLYLRGGGSLHFVSSDFTEDSTAGGVFGAIGIEFPKQKSVHGYLEASTDTAEITMFSAATGAREIKLGEFVFSGGVVLSF